MASVLDDEEHKTVALRSVGGSGRFLFDDTLADERAQELELLYAPLNFSIMTSRVPFIPT